MTDEEKAEEILQTKGCNTFCAKGCGYTEKVTELIAIGLADGRKLGKEEQWKATEKAQKKTSARIRELEKANAELKELSEMNSLSKVLIQRCKEVGIKDLYHLADYLTIIENQKHQIEKMKCCGNCKQYRWTGTCMVDDEEVSGDCYCDKWELTELELAK